MKRLNWGLGVYIVKKTIERYGSSIKLTKPSQKATTFRIKLRRVEI